MLTRRSVLLGAAAAATTPIEQVFAKASQPSTPVRFDVPANACDCHTHIYGPKMWDQRKYTPETNTAEEMTLLHQALHMKRVVIVTPEAVYGSDNSYTIAGMNVRGKNARGIAAIDENTPENEVDRLDKLGFRGIRKDLRTPFRSSPAAARDLFDTYAKRLKRVGWNFELMVDMGTVAALKDMLAGSPIPLVIDHFGFARGELGTNQPGFADLLELVRSGVAYVKLSAADRCSNLADYSDVTPLARALIAANPDRMLWGSNWPNPAGTTTPTRPIGEVTPHVQTDNARLLNLLPTWAPDPKIREKILVENPARLYRF